jgi:predicted DCC family thiol-disulfide oxidoreductase YuxK
MTDTRNLTVYYDGACLLCAREIAFYRRRSGADAVEWIDVSAFETGEVAPGLDRDRALARFHVRDDGTLVSGGQAFVRLWRALPGLHWLARILGAPALKPALDLTYVAFLKFRPLLRLGMRAGKTTE